MHFAPLRFPSISLHSEISAESAAVRQCLRLRPGGQCLRLRSGGQCLQLHSGGHASGSPPAATASGKRMGDYIIPING